MQENVQKLAKKFSRIKKAHDKALAQLRKDIEKRGYLNNPRSDKKRDKLRTRVMLIREQWFDVNDKLEKLGVDTKKMM